MVDFCTVSPHIYFMKEKYIHPIRKTSLHLVPNAIEMPDLLSIKKVKAYPPTQRFAKKLGIEISNVYGTGKNGLITKEDVKRYYDLRKK